MDDSKVGGILAKRWVGPGGMDFSADKYDLMYHGQKIDKVLHHGEVVWESENASGLLEFVFSSPLTSVFRFPCDVRGRNIKALLNKDEISRAASRLTAIPLPNDGNTVYIVDILADVITKYSFSTNTSSVSVKRALRRVLGPLPYSELNDLTHCFSGNVNLSSVSDALLTKLSNVVSVDSMFYGCESLDKIPRLLFAPCSKLTSVSLCFGRCKSLTAIPKNLLPNTVTDASACFSECQSLTIIPSELIPSMVTNANGCFSKCTGLETLNDSPFSQNEIMTTLTAVFRDCASLRQISGNIFTTLPNITRFRQIFEGCSSLEAIPSSLFANQQRILSFYCSFRNCTALKAIPSNLFANNHRAYEFAGIFSGCQSLETLPSGLFCVDDESPYRDIDCRLTFANCTNIKTLPSGLFQDNTVRASGSLFDLSRTFEGCTKLETLPSDLFGSILIYGHGSASITDPTLGSIVDESHPSVWKQSAYTFQGCTSLKSIPYGLFYNIRNHEGLSSSNSPQARYDVSVFYSWFRGCTALESIPSDFCTRAPLSDGTPRLIAVDFTYCFADCTSLKIIEDGAFIGIGTSRYRPIFSYCFEGCVNLEQAPRLWEMFPTAVGTGCFSGCTKLPFYDEIPDDWK